MTIALQTPESDLAGTVPGDNSWEIHSTHTHYLGFVIPEAAIGCFVYIRYMPYFPLSQAGVSIFEGLNNLSLLDAAHMNWQTMPYPHVEGNVITTANGLRVDFVHPGQRLHITYSDPATGTSIDVEQSGVSPLVARDAVLPGENLDGEMKPSGSEQFMHCTGEVRLRGRCHKVDSYTARDRSLAQNRTEVRGGRHAPPVVWTPMWFPDVRVGFNQVGFESPDTHPVWEGLVGLAEGMPTHHFAWVYRDQELLDVVSLRRTASKLHPLLHIPLEQTIEAEDAAGNRYRFRGETIAACPIPSWMNAFTYDSVVRWVADDLGVSHTTCQGIWYDEFQQAMKARRPLLT